MQGTTNPIRQNYIPEDLNPQLAGCSLWSSSHVFNGSLSFCVVSAAPDGVVTYARQYVSPSNLPQWDGSQKLLTKLHITSQGTIEDDGAGLLQVDFANKYVCHTVMLFDH
jgi:hypothetical protein